jgi:hypothetical protein
MPITNAAQMQMARTATGRKMIVHQLSQVDAHRTEKIVATATL